MGYSFLYGNYDQPDLITGTRQRSGMSSDSDMNWESNDQMGQRMALENAVTSMPQWARDKGLLPAQYSVGRPGSLGDSESTPPAYSTSSYIKDNGNDTHDSWSPEGKFQGTFQNSHLDANPWNMAARAALAVGTGGLASGAWGPGAALAGEAAMGGAEATSPFVWNAAADSQLANAAAGLSGGAASGAALPAVSGMEPGVLGSIGNSVSNALSGVTGGQMLGAGANVLGGVLGANAIGNAASSAAQTSANASANALALQKYMYDQSRVDQAPWLAAGNTALGQLNTGTAPGGSLVKPFGMSDYQADPGYGFRLSEGMKALEQSAAARGGLLSGSTLKGITNYGQNAASQEYGNAYSRYNQNQTNQYNRLAGMAGIGQTANAANQASAGNYTQGATNTIMGNASNQGNSAMAGGNASASMYGGVANQLGRIFSPQPTYLMNQPYTQG